MSITELEKRLVWLKDKVREMRRIGGPDYTPSKILQARVDGQIGELTYVIQLMKAG